MRKIIELSRDQFDNIYFKLQEFLLNPDIKYEVCNDEAIEYIEQHIDIGLLEKDQYSYMLVNTIFHLDVCHCILLNKDRTKIMYMGVMSYRNIHSLEHHEGYPHYNLITEDEFKYYTKYFDY